ncbi:MAG: ATP-binding cassette domain-containing protein, partial [Treponema sp.]|nr:ATP-binding cassette domain-containing protein [Treponema sp.]
MLLEVQNLKVSYGNIEALYGISFNVDKGEIVTLIGANGAGKTSTLMSLARLPRPEAPVVTSGDILYNGASLLKTEPHILIQKKMMVLVPEGRH